jgi:hypothetical protein
MHMPQKKLLAGIRRPNFRLAGAAIALVLPIAAILPYSLSAVSGFGSGSVRVFAQERGTCSNDPASPNPCDLAQRQINATCPQGRCIIEKYLQPGMNLLAAAVGLAVTASFITAGIRYSTSADNPQKVSEAKQRMVTSAMVLIGFFTFYAFLNYLIPGGLI